MGLHDLFKSIGDNIDAKLRKKLAEEVDNISLSQVINCVVDLDMRLKAIQGRIEQQEANEEDGDEEDENPSCKCCANETPEERRIHLMMHRLINALNTDKQYIGVTAMTMLLIQYFKEGDATLEKFLSAMKQCFESAQEDNK